MDKILNVVRTVAPALATAIGGPLGGMAYRAISAALSGSEDTPEEELAQAVARATPDQLLALKKAEQDFTARMKELDIDLERIASEDRSSARNREIKTKDWTPRILAATVTIGYFGTLFWMLSHGVPKDSEVLVYMLGVLGTAWGMVMGYYFGSSSGSQEKNAMINRMVRK